eukprot:TRINITY_DN12282_c0_g1_i1.p1 TRINITY_DN12282_c0_g1~~TRINITY_DN12282_c0_g1_i1.p1  ORF type:complete len:182 (+),score=66.37 TRINITY_DN12282_c0_g1_i1:55-600(+)
MSAARLLEAAQEGDVPRVRSLLDQGYSAGVRCPDTGMTALHFAAFKGHPAVAEALLAEGAHVETRDAHRLVPLHHAAVEGHVDVVKVLLEHGADPEASCDGSTPLHLALLGHHAEAAALLQAAAKPTEAGTVTSAPTPRQQTLPPPTPKAPEAPAAKPQAAPAARKQPPPKQDGGCECTLL